MVFNIIAMQRFMKIKNSCLLLYVRRRQNYTWAYPTGNETGVCLYNPVAKKKVPLVIQNSGYLSWYSCGPTVYDDSHIGHAR